VSEEGVFGEDSLGAVSESLEIIASLIADLISGSK
jgi:hypothetical protein